MTVSNDYLFQNLSTVHSDKQPTPPTIASAATIAPTNFLTFVTGTVAIANITPPVNAMHMLCLIFTDAAAATLLTTGNLLTAVVPTPNIPTLLIYDPNQKKYYGVAGNLT